MENAWRLGSGEDDEVSAIAMQNARGSQNASVSKYKRLNGPVYEPSGYLSRFSEIIPGTLGRRFRLFRSAATLLRNRDGRMILLS